MEYPIYERDLEYPYYKRDMDMIREILFVYGGLASDQIRNDFFKRLEEYDHKLHFHILLLRDAGFLLCHQTKDQQKNLTFAIYITQLTWNGYDLLESIKDEGIWKKTKETCQTVGSFSIPIIQKIAAQLLAESIRTIFKP
ncbi:MAG: DUF2513 domain-containing protein [Candidatus Kapabacteria bacterium]|nr:DUF2513 domain-containing protein [Candidatus Kapabacteria bacterium]